VASPTGATGRGSNWITLAKLVGAMQVVTGRNL
jgi:hypothetical protein